MVVRHFENMELYIRKRVSAADFLGIFREYSDFPCAIVSFFLLLSIHSENFG